MIEMKIVAQDGQDLLTQLLALGQAVFPAAAGVALSATEVPATEGPKAPEPEQTGGEQKKRSRQPKAAAVVAEPETASAQTASDTAATDKHPIDGLDDGAAQQMLRDKLTEVLRVLGPEATFAALFECAGVKKISEVKPEKYKALYDHLDKKKKEAE